MNEHYVIDPYSGTFIPLNECAIVTINRENKEVKNMTAFYDDGDRYDTIPKERIEDTTFGEMVRSVCEKEFF